MTDFVFFLSEYEDRQREFNRRRRRRGAHFPEFWIWLDERVQDMINAGERVDLDLALISTLPAIEAEEYSNMWAYGSHYRCLPADEATTHETFDSGVFVMSPQGCRASAHDSNIVDAELPYVGLLNRIIVVTYSTMTRTVMKCSWIKPNLAGNPSIRQDEHGFWLAKYNSRQDPARENPYVFPYSVSQVCIPHPRLYHSFQHFSLCEHTLSYIYKRVFFQHTVKGIT